MQTDDELWSAIGDPSRRRILDLLVSNGEVSASWLAGHVPFSRQAVSKHLGRARTGRADQPTQAGPGSSLPGGSRPPRPGRPGDGSTSPPSGTGDWPRSNDWPKQRTPKHQRHDGPHGASRLDERGSKMTNDLSTKIGSHATGAGAPGMPAAVDRATFQAELDGLRVREKAHTREGDAIAAARRRLPMVEVDAEPHADRAGRAAHPARRVRRAPTAHRLLLHVARRPARGRAVRRLHVGHHAGHGAVLPAFPRHHLRGLLSGPLRREHPLPRLHGLGHAVVLRTAPPSTGSSSGARSA